MEDEPNRPRRSPQHRANSNPDPVTLQLGRRPYRVEPAVTPALRELGDGSCSFCGGNPNAPLRDMWAFVIERELQSQNARLSNTGVKRWAYAADRDAWLQWMHVTRVNLRIPPATRRRRVVVERRFAGRQRAYDFGNLVGGAKPLIDAMALAQLIVGDAPHELEDHYQQSKTDGAPGVRIWLQEFA